MPNSKDSFFNTKTDLSLIVQNLTAKEDATNENLINEDEHINMDVNGDVSSINFSYQVPKEKAGVRLDKLVHEVLPNFSRSQIQEWIKKGDLLVNHQHQKNKYLVKGEDCLSLTTQLENHSEDKPENIPLDVIYQDDTVIIINKPVGLVVHPGAGNWTGTLVNALLYHFPEQATLPRAGLVHRIDKDTSGLLVVARSKSAQLDLINQLKDKSVYRLYQCLVVGTPSEILSHKLIDLPIGRHPKLRTQMSVCQSGKPAITQIDKAEEIGYGVSLVNVSLQTGRTHQIRVHMSHIGYPLIGDKVYGKMIKGKISANIRTLLQNFPRQALHAHTLGFIHPKTQKAVQFHIPIADDICHLIKQLQSI